MAQKTSEPNAMNSELDPKKHPSGARIEKLMSDADQASAKASAKASAQGASNESTPKAVTGPEKGVRGETLRPSEREDRYISPEEPAEGSRDLEQPSAPHRMDANDRNTTH